MDLRWPISNFQSLLESNGGFLEKAFRDHELMTVSRTLHGEEDVLREQMRLGGKTKE